VRDLWNKVESEYSSLLPVEERLTEAFRYWKYYFPDITVPAVYTYISGLYYEAPVEYYDSAMIISLDLYLGRDFEPYRSIGLPMYATRRMDSRHLVPDCMKQAGMSMLPRDLPQKTLLDQMILHGKLMYFLDLVLPGYPDSVKIGFSGDELRWCQDNDSRIWSLMIENELLFETDPFIVNKFIQDGPFTSGLPEESPAMIGRWIGWQIIRAFVKEQGEIPASELLAIQDSQDILSRSHYKPVR
jgi:hypothetical protein